MIDLIIPHYNNYQGLYDTLNSIGFLIKGQPIYIYIVDDASTFEVLQQVKNIPSLFPHLNITIYSLPENKGPGYARQFGIEQSNSPYILFIDAGDLFIAQTSVISYSDFINEHPETSLFRFPFIYAWEDESGFTFDIKKYHNEFHGTLVKRSLIEQYDLKIPSANYYLEDIAFITLLSALDENSYNNLTEPMVIKVVDPNGLTGSEEKCYQESVPGLVHNTIDILHNIHGKVPIQFEKVYMWNIWIFIYTNWLFSHEIYEAEQFYVESNQLIYQFYKNYIQNSITNEEDQRIFSSLQYTLLPSLILAHEMSDKFIALLQKWPFLEWQNYIEKEGVKHGWLPNGKNNNTNL